MKNENWKTVRLGDMCEFKKRPPRSLALQKQEKGLRGLRAKHKL